MPLLRSEELRQLDQRVSIRYQLKPLNEEETGAYISHRLAIAKAARDVVFTPAAISVVYRYSGGTPRLINLLCDRALLAGANAQVTRIDDALIGTAAEALDLRAVEPKRVSWFNRLLKERAR
jgi:general secretion pathway protein A